MRWARAILTLTLVALGCPAMAQDWQVRSSDDGSFFVHSLGGPPGSFALQCGERSAQGLSPMATGNTTPLITVPGAVRIGFGSDALGVPQTQDRRSDVMIVIGTAGFQLPELVWDELDGTWGLELPEDDPVFLQLAQTEMFGIYTGSDRQMRQISTLGFAQAYDQIRQLCAAGFAALGQPWGADPVQAAAPQPPSGPMEALAMAAVTKGCGGPSDLDTGAILRGQIDGDGTEDVVLDWSAITCRSGLARPFCGASMCSADVFLSARGGTPETLLALGVRLQPLSNGLQAVATGGSLAMCQERAASACEFLWYWTGSGLEELR